MAAPAPLHVDRALDELVNQFADPMSFLRELVQNALDAGSSEVEISIEWEPGADGRGVAVILVEDWGEGMTREIIETKLTRLFSSAKDGDMTKIGKFGIGFASVFAIEPDVVCVDTSRDGQHWRVLFDAHRRFQLLRLDTPVDGTKIRILKTMEDSEQGPFVDRVQRVLSYWCRHTDGEIRFQGELVNRPLDLDAPCQVTRDDGFSRIIVGHPSRKRSFFGFYNTGLTLMEREEGYSPGLVFKVSSPHLEHTLTRDDIIRDAGFERVMRSVEETIDGPLLHQVFARLEASLLDDAPDRLGYLYRAASWHAKRDIDALSSVSTRTVFRSPAGTRLTVERLRARHRDAQVLVAREQTPMTDAAEALGATVARTTKDPRMMATLRALVPEGTEVVSIEERFAMPLLAGDDREREKWSPLARAVGELVDGWGGKLAGVEVGHFDYPGSSIRDRVAITQKVPGELTSLSESQALGTGFFSRRRTLVLNADHPAITPVVALARPEPLFAAYLVVKLFFLGDRLDAEADGRLLELVEERRWRDSSS